jgi:TusA-related sulfurtransferase
MAGLGSISTLDAPGLVCPEPVLRTAKAMRSVDPGGTLTVLGDGSGGEYRLPLLLPSCWA